MLAKEDILKLERAIKDAEVRISQGQIKLDAIDKELASLGAQEAQLTENLKVLKTRGIIALAMEFRKARSELGKVRTKLGQVNWDRALAEKAVGELNRALINSKQLYKELREERDKNLIRGNFPRKVVPEGEDNG